MGFGLHGLTLFVEGNADPVGQEPKGLLFTLGTSRVNRDSMLGSGPPILGVHSHRPAVRIIHRIVVSRDTEACGLDFSEDSFVCEHCE